MALPKVWADPAKVFEVEVWAGQVKVALSKVWVDAAKAFKVWVEAQVFGAWIRSWNLANEHLRSC